MTCIGQWYTVPAPSCDEVQCLPLFQQVGSHADTQILEQHFVDLCISGAGIVSGTYVYSTMFSGLKENLKTTNENSL